MLIFVRNDIIDIFWIQKRQKLKIIIIINLILWCLRLYSVLKINWEILTVQTFFKGGNISILNRIPAFDPASLQINHWLVYYFKKSFFMTKYHFITSLHCFIALCEILYPKIIFFLFRSFTVSNSTKVWSFVGYTLMHFKDVFLNHKL